MPDRDFPFVTVLNEYTGETRIILSLYAAAEFILYDWPVSHSNTARTARRACLGAMMGNITSEQARKLFVRAAKETGILIEKAPCV
jgi:hypothetical protein